MTDLPYPQVEPTGRTCGWGCTEWRLISDFFLEVPLGSGSGRWVVPKGTLTDFASVPRALHWLISPVDPDVIAAALIHDRLYSQAETEVWASAGNGAQTTTSRVSRFLADALFRDLMRMYGAPVWKRVLSYYAVRVCGCMAYW